MGKTTAVIFLFFLVGIIAFGFFNQEIVTIKVPGGQSYEISKFILVLLSMAVGVFITFIFFAIRDTKKFIDNWQYQKKQKQDTKVQELYSKALNSLLAHNENDAKGALQGILSEEPDHINALLRLGDIAVSEEDYQQANTYYQKARMISSHNLETLFALEGLMEKTERWTEALTYLEDILEIDDENLTALYKKRDIYERLGKWDELVYLQKSILKHEHTERGKRREQQNLIGYEYEYGRFSLEGSQLEKAKKAFKTVLRIEKDFIPAVLGVAEIMMREGENEEAINFLEKAYESTSSLIILARLEDLILSLAEPSRLIRIYKSSISQNPQNTVTKFFLGKLFYRLEMVDDAFEILTSIDTGGTSYPELHFLLGNLYLRKNRLDKAVNEFKKVLDIKKSVRLPYCCNNCAFTAEEWSGRCPNCFQWNTFQFNLDGTCKA